MSSDSEHAVTGPIDYRHVFIDITNMEVQASTFTRAGRTCPGAMGYSFAAGTTDGEDTRNTAPYLSISAVLFSICTPEQAIEASSD